MDSGERRSPRASGGGPGAPCPGGRPPRDRAFATVLVVLGIGLFVLGVILHRVRAFSVGPKGIDARLDRIESKVDRMAIRAALANLVAEGDRVLKGLLTTRDHTYPLSSANATGQDEPGRARTCVDGLTRRRSEVRIPQRLPRRSAASSPEHPSHRAAGFRSPRRMPRMRSRGYGADRRRLVPR